MQGKRKGAAHDMTDKQFNTLFTHAMDDADRDSFISFWESSDIWEDSDGKDHAEQIAEIWDMTHLTMRDIRSHTGLTQAAFGTRFCIPMRTIQDWEGGRRNCPPYVKLLLAQAAGCFKR